MVSRSSPNRVGVIFRFSSAVFLFPAKSVQQSCRPNNRLLIPQLLDVEGDQTKPVRFEGGFDVVFWLLDGALDDGEYLQTQKLYRLMFLAQAYLASALK